MCADTIAAIATPPGVGGVGVVRISGPAVTLIAKAILGRIPRPRRASLRWFRDAGRRPIDQGIAIFFPGPRSFTGEDSLELQGHGGPIVLDLLLSRCLDLGARVARPGEFTERAYLNGKLDLVQAEAIADLIASSTASAARLSLRSLQGAFSRRVGVLVDGLLRLRTFLEATLDFPEEEVELQSRAVFARDLGSLQDTAQTILSEASQGQRMRDGLTVVIAGPPNAGKSSLLNTLLQYDAAIVTPIPGTTRDLLRCDFEIDGLPVRLIDTAGLRESLEPAEQEGVRRAREQCNLADLILWVYDVQVGLEPDDLAGLPAATPMTVVRNKVDLPVNDEGAAAPHGVSRFDVSALTGLGIAELRQHLKVKAGVDGLGEGSFVARRRHLDALRRGLAAMHSAAHAVECGLGPEVVALELLEAQRTFGEITGDVTPDDLLTQIFTSFCIGK